MNITKSPNSDYKSPPSFTFLVPHLSIFPHWYLLHPSFNPKSLRNLSPMDSDLPQTLGKTIPDAWDYKDCPAERSKTGGWGSAAMILGPSITHAYHLKAFSSPGFLSSYIFSVTLAYMGNFFFFTFRWGGL